MIEDFDHVMTLPGRAVRAILFRKAHIGVEILSSISTMECRSRLPVSRIEVSYRTRWAQVSAPSTPYSSSYGIQTAGILRPDQHHCASSRLKKPIMTLVFKAQEHHICFCSKVGVSFASPPVSASKVWSWASHFNSSCSATANNGRQLEGSRLFRNQRERREIAFVLSTHRRQHCIRKYFSTCSAITADKQQLAGVRLFGTLKNGSGRDRAGMAVASSCSKLVKEIACGACSHHKQLWGRSFSRCTAKVDGDQQFVEGGESDATVVSDQQRVEDGVTDDQPSGDRIEQSDRLKKLKASG